MHIFSAVPGDPLVTRMDHHVKNVIIVTSQLATLSDYTIRSGPSYHGGIPAEPLFRSVMLLGHSRLLAQARSILRRLRARLCMASIRFRRSGLVASSFLPDTYRCFISNTNQKGIPFRTVPERQWPRESPVEKPSRLVAYSPSSPIS